MKHQPKITKAYFRVEGVSDARLVLVFENEDDASKFAEEYPLKDLAVHAHRTHVFFPAPPGLEAVAGGPNGETAFQFHHRKEAEDFIDALRGYGFLGHENHGSAGRTVYVKQEAQESVGEPLYPGVA